MSIKFQLPELKEGSSCSSGSSGRRTPSRQLTTNTAILRASSDEERLKQGLAVSQFALPGASASWIIRLLNAPLDDLVVYPRRYLAASHEVFLYTLIVTWVITLIFHPEQIFDHPAQPIIGSFNPCFGWDYPPASYISVVLCGVNVYLTWRYTWLERTRVKLRNPGKLLWHESFSFYACVPLALASNAWLLLWLIGPPTADPRHLEPAEDAEPWMKHTGLFFFYAASSWLACLGNFCESAFSADFAKHVETKHKLFMAAYSLAVINLVGVYLYDLLLYEKGRPPPLPWWAPQISDLLWLACIGALPYQTVPEPPLRLECEIGAAGMADPPSARKRSALERKFGSGTSGAPVQRQPTIGSAVQFELWNPVGLALIDLLNQKLHKHATYPRKYLWAASETLAVALLATLALTFALHPERILRHPMRTITGAIGPTFGWDFAPASYIGLSMCSVNIYLIGRYAWLERARIKIRNPGELLWYEKCCFYGCLPLLVASIWFQLLWLTVPRWDTSSSSTTDVTGWAVHTGVFLLFVITKQWVYVFSYVESAYSPHTTVEPKHKLFAVAYGLAVSLMVLCYAADLALYTPGQPPPVPPLITQAANVLWFLCVLSASFFTPLDPPLVVVTTVLDKDPELIAPPSGPSVKSVQAARSRKGQQAAMV